MSSLRPFYIKTSKRRRLPVKRLKSRFKTLKLLSSPLTLLLPVGPSSPPSAEPQQQVPLPPPRMERLPPLLLTPPLLCLVDPRSDCRSTSPLVGRVTRRRPIMPSPPLSLPPSTAVLNQIPACWALGVPVLMPKVPTMHF